MQKHDFDRFGNAFGTMGEVFDKKLSPVLTSIYFHALSQYPLEDVEKAINRAISSCRWFPKPVELIEFIPGTQPVLLEHKAEAEASKIIAHMRSYGSRVQPDLSDPVTRFLMERRWPYQNWASQVLESELKWWVKEFKSAYEAHQGSDVPLQISAPDNVLKLVSDIGNMPETRKINGRCK